jgi:mRNA-degrading endonuclease toxin of MazEF toxin-antitoxin module
VSSGTLRDGNTAVSLEDPETPNVSRGSLVRLKPAGGYPAELAIVVSNDVQNEKSSKIVLVPLERRNARLNAPFAVDLGRAEGLRDLHAARCDWLFTANKSAVERIERAQLPRELFSELDAAIRVALSV